METKDGVKSFYASSRKAWREWLIENHDSEKSVWLIIYKMDSGISSVYYSEAVDEALCFGWIDSKPNKRDEKSYYQFFSRRNPKSNWSRVNKEKINELIKGDLMHKSGLEMVHLAKKSGTWTALDDVENLVVPPDLQKLFDQDKIAKNNWEQFPRSVKRGILEWILNAKRPETRLKRIAETVQLAHENIRANYG